MTRKTRPPVRRAGFPDKQDEIALSRLVGGVHYPTDTTAGEALADSVHERLLKSPGYLKAINEAKTFLIK